MIDSHDDLGIDSTILHSNLTIFATHNETENNTDFNNTLWSDEAVCSPVSTGSYLSTPIFQFFIFFMYGTIFTVALIGNGLVCYIVQNLTRVKSVTNFFFMNLAVGDILMTIFCVPFSFVSMLVLRYWPFGNFMCKIVNYSQGVSVLVSAYTLIAISIDRYMAIIRPFKPRLGTTKAKIIVAGVWAGALFTAAPIAVVSETQRPTEWHQFCKADVCIEKWKEVKENEQYSLALMVLQFGLPLGVLVYTYARIAHVVWGGRPPGEEQSARDLRIQKDKKKMIKMMITVVVVFIVCWLPLNTFIILWSAHETDDSWATWPGMSYMWFVVHWLAMSHCCYNPIIYCYMNKGYRLRFKMVLKRLLPHTGERSDPSLQFRQRSSMYEGVPLTEMAAVNSINRRENSSSSSKIRRSCSSRTSGLPVE